MRITVIMSLPSTHLLLSSSPVGCTLFPSKSRYHRCCYYYGARTYGNPRPAIRRGQLNNNGSRGEEVQDEVEDDETFFQLMEEEIDNDDDDDTENSLDLLFRFLYSMFKKLSKRARKASRAVLPDVISPQLLTGFFFGLHFLF